MIVKLMGSENVPDADARKTYRIFDGVHHVEFVRGVGGAYVHIDGRQFAAVGNVYVMNDAGKTVSSFGVSDYVADPVG